MNTTKQTTLSIIIDIGNPLIFNPLAAEFIYLATSAEYAVPINLPTAVKGIEKTILHEIITVFSDMAY